MRQLVLDSSNGSLAVRDVPTPRCHSGAVLVRTSYSLVSSGTERSKIELAAKPLWEKALNRPGEVAKVLEAVRKDGIIATAMKVRDRLKAPQPLGYSLAGTVIEIGAGCEGFRLGIPVACGGATACHAEVVVVPRNLAVPVPHGVPPQDACFATVASVALHGLRTAGVSLGDRVLVLGLGLIGQLAARLAVVAGAHVFGVDPLNSRAQLALDAGVERADTALDKSTVQQIADWSSGRGVDAVLVTAGAADNQPLSLAAAAARDRARVIVIGAVDLNVPREPFYEKELKLVVSRSYGPGRYDPDFEEKGAEYPVGFVPWTERRNMEEILGLLAAGRLSLRGLGAAPIPFERAHEGYELLSRQGGAGPISVVLEYDASRAGETPVHSRSHSRRFDQTMPTSPAHGHAPRSLSVSFVGMGNFASSYLLPAVKSEVGVVLNHVANTNPLKAEMNRSRAGFRSASIEAESVFRDQGTDVVFIATRHDSHARYAEVALRAGLAVFVEKPLALSEEELSRVESTLRATQGRLMVGFNRRFAPATVWALQALGSNRAGLRFLCRVNAGVLPDHHWILDPEVGGGRLIGEVCHFLDLAYFVANAPPIDVTGRLLDEATSERGGESYRIEVRFENGATAGIDYLAMGDSCLAKERIEIHRSGTSIVIDDFRAASVHRGGKRRVKRWARRSKGHHEEVHLFLEAVRTGGPTPILEKDSLLTSALTLAAARSVREGRPLRHDEW